jgi:hypothetical protein
MVTKEIQFRRTGCPTYEPKNATTKEPSNMRTSLNAVSANTIVVPIVWAHSTSRGFGGRIHGHTLEERSLDLNLD